MSSLNILVGKPIRDIKLAETSVCLSFFVEDRVHEIELKVVQGKIVLASHTSRRLDFGRLIDFRDELA